MEEVAGNFFSLIRLALLDQPKRLFRNDNAVGRHLGGLLRPIPSSCCHLAGIASLREDSEILYGLGVDDIAGQQQTSGQYRTQPVEEHVQAAQCRTQEAGGRHTDLGVAGDHGNICHQSDFEAAPECIATDFANRDLREAHQVVVKAERLAVHRESAALAGTALSRSSFAVPRLFRASLSVPAVRVIHVRPRAEHTVCSAQQRNSQVVVVRDAVQAPGNGLAHVRVVGVALLGVVQRYCGNPLFWIDFEKNAIVAAV
jgi:hypothetical protein